MPYKYGYLFRGPIRRSLSVNRRIQSQLAKCVEDIPASNQLALLGSILTEDNDVIITSFKGGYLVPALNQLRHAQEVSNKIFAFHVSPQLRDKPKVHPTTASQEFSRKGLKGWGEKYTILSQITHVNRDFLVNIYPSLRQSIPTSENMENLITYHICTLNVLCSRALFVLVKETEANGTNVSDKRQRQIDSIDDQVMELMESAYESVKSVKENSR